MVDMGHLQTTVIVASFGGEDGDGGDGDQESSAPPTTEAMTSTKGSAANRCPYKVLAVRSDQELGALSFDERMFQHFGAEVRVVAGLLSRRPIMVTWVPNYASCHVESNAPNISSIDLVLVRIF